MRSKQLWEELAAEVDGQGGGGARERLGWMRTGRIMLPLFYCLRFPMMVIDWSVHKLPMYLNTTKENLSGRISMMSIILLCFVIYGTASERLLPCLANLIPLMLLCTILNLNC
jgi:hypothetical protein